MLGARPALNAAKGWTWLHGTGGDEAAKIAALPGRAAEASFLQSWVHFDRSGLMGQVSGMERPGLCVRLLPVMNRTDAHHAPARALTPRPTFGRIGRSLLAAGLLTLATLGCAGATSADAASPATATPAVSALEQATPRPEASQSQNDRQYVFTVGRLIRVQPNAVVLGFEDGASETFALDTQTTIRTQNGDPERFADLEVGDMLIVITEENDPTATTIVNGGDAGFHEAGPADIRGHEHDEACAACEEATP